MIINSASVVGGPGDLATNYNWPCPTSSLPKWPYVGYLNYDWGYKPSHK